jgi:ABC-type branched-subunit amino acid transport system substrate-binding protein/predicted Ser/Thr protein kinase
MADAPEDSAPKIISHYRLDKLLGSGGMGAVYGGIDRRDETPVAVKLLHPHLADDASFRERFEREAHVAALLRSPYTVHVIDYGLDGRHYFIAMEFVEGQTLKDALRNGALAWNRAVRIATQVARALEEAEARGVVHRDIKPENILLRAQDSVKVSDFGIARQAGTATLTVTGAFIGTLSYAPPEQMLGKADHRSDIYALGATLYHMVSGRPPFSGTVEEMLRLVREAAPPLDPLTGLPRAIVEILLRCLDKDPNRRYQSASELATALTAAGRGDVLAEEATIGSSTVIQELDATLPQGVTGGSAQDADTRAATATGYQPVSLQVKGPRRGLPLLSRFGSTRYDLIVRNETEDAVVLDLQAADPEGACRFSLPDRVLVRPRTVSSVSMQVRRSGGRLAGGRRTHGFTVSASRGDGRPPTTAGGQYSDPPPPWLPLGGGVVSLGGLAAGAAIFLGIFSGGDGDGADGTVSPTGQALKIGALLPISGPLSDLAPAYSNAMQLAVEEINESGGVLGQPLQLAEGDTGGDAVGEAVRLIQQEHVSAIVDVAASTTSLDVAQSATVPNGIVQLSPASASPDLTTATDNDLLFRLILSDAAQGIALAQLAADRGYDTVCSSFVDVSYGRATNDLFKQASPALTIIEVPHQSRQQTYAAELDACAGADALAAITFDDGSAQTLLREAAERGIAEFLLVNELRYAPLFASLGWQSFDGALGTDLGVIDSSASTQFEEAYDAAFGEPPSQAPFIRETYDAVYLLALAAEIAKSTDSVALRDALRTVANPPGPEVAPGRDGFEAARNLISSETDVNYNGAAGPLDIDVNGDTDIGGIEIWRVDANAQRIVSERVIRVTVSTRGVSP